MDSKRRKKNNKKHIESRWSSKWCFCLEFELEYCIVNPLERAETEIAQGEAVYDQLTGEMYVWSMTDILGRGKAMHLRFRDGFAWCRFKGEDGEDKGDEFQLIHEQCYEDMDTAATTPKATASTAPTTVGTQRYKSPQPIAVKEVDLTDPASAAVQTTPKATAAKTPTTVGTQKCKLPQPIAVKEVDLTDPASAAVQ